MVAPKPDQTKDRLTPMEAAFARTYAATHSLTASARQDGYSGSNPVHHGNTMLARPTVQAEIARLTAETKAKNDAIMAWLVKELVNMAGADLTQVLQQAPDGSIELRPLAEIDQEARSTLAEIEQSACDGDGRRRWKIKQHPKLGAIQILCRLLGLERTVTEHVVTPAGEAVHLHEAQDAIARAIFAPIDGDGEGE